MGTAIGLGGEAKMLDENGRLPGMKRVLLVDSLAAVAGGVTSSSSNTTYIESASGISDGGRTGLTAVVVGALFLAAMFFSPIAGVIPPEATAPALVLVGYFMMTLAKDISWSEPGLGIPALLTIVMMPFTYSITNGLGAGAGGGPGAPPPRGHRARRDGAEREPSLVHPERVPRLLLTEQR